jgi:hypothetical protein
MGLKAANEASTRHDTFNSQPYETASAAWAGNFNFGVY